MKILITGGSGFLSKNLNESLNSNLNIFLPSKKEMNCLCIEDIDDYINKNNIDFVIHAAGKVGGITENIKNPSNFFLENINMGLNVIKVCLNNNIKNLLNIGSINSFPINDKDISADEEDLLSGPISSEVEPYGIAKGVVAKYAKYASLENNVNYKTLHLSNLFGKFDSFGENAHMLPAIISRIHKAKTNDYKSVEIWGDGSAKRTFLYALDVCKFINEIIVDFESFPQDFILKGNNNYSVLEYNKIISEVLGYEGEFSFNIKKPVGYKVRKINSKYSELYDIKFTPIKESIDRVYKYYLKEVLDEN